MDLTCWRLTQEHVLPLGDQNTSISLGCLDTNPLWGVSETYRDLSLRWRALNRQFISLSHFRLCFLADKWHLLPKPSGSSPLPATTALLGWTPNIYHKTLSVRVCLSGSVHIWFLGVRAEWLELSLSTCIYCLVLKLVTETLFGEPARSSFTSPPNSILRCTHATQPSQTTALSDANTASRWPVKQREIMLSHDTWDQPWQLQIRGCYTFHPLTDLFWIRSCFH